MATSANAGETTTYDSMELATLVPLGSSLSILCFSCAELTEVLGGSRCHITEELHFDAAQRLTFPPNLVSFEGLLRKFGDGDRTITEFLIDRSTAGGP
jgi:hypothetical protein